MRFLSGWLSRTAAPKQTFSETPPRPIDQMFMELWGRGLIPRVSREEALTVPAMQRGRNMICAIATLPLVQYGTDRRVIRNPLFEQLDPDVPNVVTLAQTIEDLLFEAIAWWRIEGFGWDGYPVSVRHLDPATVSLVPPGGRSPAPLPSGEDPRNAVVYIDGEEVSASEVIRFDSPNPGVLKVCGRAIKRAVLLDRAAAMYADDPRPMDFFTPTEGHDPANDDVVQQILDDWRLARKQRATGYVPAALKYNTVDVISPADLQLVDLQRQAGLEIANAIGIDPEDLGISTTSRTYQNAVDRRQDRINETLAPYMRAVTDRLSMWDVTKRGNLVRFDLDDYMKADPKTRWEVYKTAKEIGAMDVPEIREEERLPVKAMPAAPAPQKKPAVPDTVEAMWPASTTFDGQAAHQFTEFVSEQFTVDREKRIVAGLVLPYGDVAKKFWRKYRFEPGALKWTENKRVKLLRDHSYAQALGVLLEAEERPEGMFARFKVARGEEGDRALALAEDGVLDGFSVGVDWDDASDTVPDPQNKGVTLVRRADWRETSLTAMPAFDNARVTKVAASRTGEDAMPEETTTTEPTTAPAAPAVVPGTANFTSEQVSSIVAEAMRQLQTTETRHVVDPTRGRRTTARTSVTDPQSYRFDRKGVLQPAAHDFGMDFVRAVHPDHKDHGAHQRVMEFMREQFDVASADVNELNPTINLPRYIDQREFKYPIWSAINKGAPPNGIQGFSWPKFSSASGLVGAHTEGTEPSSGTYVTTNQTVTPTPVSGKAKITRETWDMGGTPGVGNLIWSRMLRDWFEALEARAVAVLDAATPTALGTFTAGGGTTGQTLAAQMRSSLAKLQFVRGGFRFDTTFTQADLYDHLTGALDGSGRPLFPPIGPTNAHGTVDDRYQSININGVPFLPAWALAASGSVAASSYLIDRNAVDGWATAPQQLTFDNHEVAHVYLGMWGYGAAAINDLAGVREISYDPVP